MKEIPKYALRAYGLLYTKYGTEEEFSQDSLNWLVSASMRKKIFATLLHAGWIMKKSRRKYACIDPKTIFTSMFSFKVPEVLKKSKREYCYSGMSAVEIWTDFSYIQRSWEHSPYFIKIKEADISYWKEFLADNGIPFFVEDGSFIGEFIVLQPKKNIDYIIYQGLPVEKLPRVVTFCQKNTLFEYALAYLKKKFNLKITVKKELLAEVP